MIDFHVHSNFSDGTYSPQKLCELAYFKKLKAIALTDHDTIDGIKSFMESDVDILKVPGVEISLDIENGTFHMLGLFIDYNNLNLKKNLDQLKSYRRERNEKILKKLSEFFDEEITFEDISTEHIGELGRPHIAKFLVKKGLVSTTLEAFEKYLSKGKILYEQKLKMDTECAIEMINQAGGIAVLAHPITLNMDEEKFEIFLKKLVDINLGGIEGICPLHSKSDCNFYLEMAKKYNLIVTAGSDFHGDNKDNVELGNLGCCSLDKKVADKLIQKAIDFKAQVEKPA